MIASVYKYNYTLTNRHHIETKIKTKSSSDWGGLLQKCRLSVFSDLTAVNDVHVVACRSLSNLSW